MYHITLENKKYKLKKKSPRPPYKISKCGPWAQRFLRPPPLPLPSGKIRSPPLDVLF